MRRIFQLSVLCLAIGTVSACKGPDQIVATEDIPTAGLRFINAVPDTGAMDFRFIDLVENGHFNIGFRNNPVTSSGVTASTTIEYKNYRAGSRHMRIFMSPPTTGASQGSQAIASTIVFDSTLSLTAGHNYTVLVWGNARGGAPKMRMTVLDDAPADPGSNVALRVINAGANLGAVDVRAYPAAGAIPGTATWAGVAELSVSAYTNASPGNINFNAQPAGGGAAIFPDQLALLGAPATVDIVALPGTTVAGSAVSAILYPRSVAGSQAASFTTPGMSFAWDRRPPRAAGT